MHVVSNCCYIFTVQSFKCSITSINIAYTLQKNKNKSLLPHDALNTGLLVAFLFKIVQSLKTDCGYIKVQNDETLFVTFSVFFSFVLWRNLNVWRFNNEQTSLQYFYSAFILTIKLQQNILESTDTCSKAQANLHHIQKCIKQWFKIRIKANYC